MSRLFDQGTSCIHHGGVIATETKITPEEVREEYNFCQELKKEVKDRYNRDMDEISVALVELTKRCSHSDVTRHYDASGNNDTYDVCDDCDATLD